MPLLSLEALHQLHIFIFVLAIVHVVFCATTMVLGAAKVALHFQPLYIHCYKYGPFLFPIAHIVVL